MKSSSAFRLTQGGKIRPLISERELDILKLVAEGKSSPEIGSLLFISAETVSTHRKNMHRKLNACNGASLIKTAFDLGILKPV